MRARRSAVHVGVFAIGVAAGGFLFADVQPRSFLAVTDCRDACYHPNELAGLLASVGISRAGRALPLVVKETDRCVAIEHPVPAASFHYVIFPKKDVKDIADVSLDAQPYVLDCLALIREIVHEKGLRDYRVVTNGPGIQAVRYLHFHLMSGDHRGAS